MTDAPGASVTGRTGTTVLQGGRRKAYRPLPDAERAAALRAGIEAYERGDFFEAHEVWEEVWTEYQGPSRKFYQGLIQVAVALHHFGNGNLRGATKLYHSSRAYLEPYRPRHMGLDLDKLFVEMERCFAPIFASQEERPQVEINPELIPEIHLDAGN